MLIFFFFKQKTAYEMRISDWSSDVCSSDLRQQQADNRSEVGNEGEETGDKADGEPEVEAGKRQANGIEHRQRQADRSLAAQEACQRLVDLAPELADRLLVPARQRVVGPGNHAGPIDRKSVVSGKRG